VQSCEYTKTFNSKVVTIAYLNTGQSHEYRVQRQKTIYLRIHELLKEICLEDWTNIFKVASVQFQNIYDNPLFEKDIWHKPESSTAVRLFD